ncbi:hypothetical protein SLA2020_183450 [Shorea laevis]
MKGTKTYYNSSISPFKTPLIQRNPPHCFFLKSQRLQIVMKSSSIPTTPSLIFSSLASLPHFMSTFLSNAINPPLHPSVDPDHVFTGNLAPVDEMSPTECQVIKGELPPSLSGVYIRNGPNPQHKPPHALHFYEADGMLHSLRLSGGHATYCSRFVKTYKYMIEHNANSAIFPNVLSGFHGFFDVLHSLITVARIIVGQIDLTEGFGMANTSLACIAEKLLALNESDLPYIIKSTTEGDIVTLGRWDFDRKLLASMTAHPKFDMDTKETFAFRCSLIFPYLIFFRFDRNGIKQREVPILSVKNSIFVHDFGITKRFAVFEETQLELSLKKVLMGRGTLVEYKPNKIPRIGIIPKYATSDSEMKWFEVPGFNALHILNSWETGEDEIVLVGSNVMCLENIYQKVIRFSLEKVKINTSTGEVSRSVLSPRNLELGTINPSFVGRKTKYAYLGVLEEIPKMSGVVKLDLETGVEVGRRFFGQGCYGGEPLFVRKQTSEQIEESEEDDGYLMTFVHDEKIDESRFVLMDAKSPDLSVLAEVRLPRRIPYGFHGIFSRDHENI